VPMLKRGSPEKIQSVTTGTEDFEKNWKKLKGNSSPNKKGEKASADSKKGNS